MLRVAAILSPEILALAGFLLAVLLLAVGRRSAAVAFACPALHVLVIDSTLLLVGGLASSVALLGGRPLALGIASLLHGTAAVVAARLGWDEEALVPPWLDQLGGRCPAVCLRTALRILVISWAVRIAAFLLVFASDLTY